MKQALLQTLGVAESGPLGPLLPDILRLRHRRLLHPRPDAWEVAPGAIGEGGIPGQ